MPSANKIESTTNLSLECPSSSDDASDLVISEDAIKTSITFADYCKEQSQMQQQKLKSCTLLTKAKAASRTLTGV